MDVNPILRRSAVLLLLLNHLCQGQYQLIAPSAPVIAPVGSTVELPCQPDPEEDFGNTAVEWARPDLSPRFVHIRRDGANLLLGQNPLFLGRTSLDERKLRHGDMSLQLSRVKTSDNGTYRCFVPQKDFSAHVQLLVVSVSSPSVSLTKGPGGSPVLQCFSGHWYPEPELQWLDSEGRLLPGGAPQTHVKEDLFSVSSRLSVEQGSAFTCKVRESSTKQSRETLITISEDFMEGTSCSVAWTLFSLGVLLLLLIPVAFFVWKIKFRKSKRNNRETADNQVEEQEPMMTSEEHSVVLNQTKHSLELKQNEQLKQSEDLRKVEDELQFVKDMIEKLTETKMFQTNLKDKVHRTIHQLEHDIAEKEQKKKNKKIKITFGEDKRVYRIHEMEKQLSEFVNIFENTDKEITKTTKMIEKTKEREDRLERDREELMKQKLQEKSVGSVKVEEEGKVKDEADQETSPEQKNVDGPETKEQQDSTSEELDKLVTNLKNLHMKEN